MTTTNEIRRSFLDYFARHGHHIVSSAPLVPQNDPTLMFVNAGMVPFKDVFTGLETRRYATAVSSQKCVRAGGKHNDLDNVGYTARHHTFFEMLGNFSFGAYFKHDAIQHAWTLLTREWGINPDRLIVTVYHTDDEAFDLWKVITGLPDDRIIRIATNDNFWSMGETGPCGPCSEIFYDHGPHIAGGPPGSPEQDGDRFVEIWNLVFMQYEQVDATTRLELPRPSIDTGMGLERVAAVLQGTHDNFETDTFRLLIAASGELTGTATDGAFKAAHRIIADHLRTSGFLIADGVLPSNEGRGYVLRRIMRRAMRHAHLLGTAEPLLHRLVPALSAAMGNAYPELIRAQPLIEATLQLEETQFRRTLDNGLRLLETATAGMQPGAVLSGAVVFKLYDTFGFPYDLTEDALRERGLEIDRGGFEAAMTEQRRAARAAWTGSGQQASDSLWFDLVDQYGATEFVGYASDTAQAQVVALIQGGARVDHASGGDDVAVLVNQTPFYAESGGQIGDAGRITGDIGLQLTVSNTSKPLGKLHVHHARVERGLLAVGDIVTLTVDVERRLQLRANHSATHLLHAALRHQLGHHVTQKGSLVAPDRLRFDFSQPRALTAAELAGVETDVNTQIRHNALVTTRLMTPDAAIAAGAMALFGEKYGDEVRVLSMGRVDDEVSYSTELCGGMHVGALGDIGLFKIIGESAVASGVRRIEALTGEAARTFLTVQEDRLKAAATALRSRPDEVPARIVALVDERKRLERDLADARRQVALGGSSGAGARGLPGPGSEVAAGPVELIGGSNFVGRVVHGLDAKSLRGLVDDHKQRLGSGIVAVVAVNDGRAAVAIGVTDDLTSRFSAVDLVRVAAAAVGGQGGGGRPDMAQAGGPDGAQAAAAIDAVRAALGEAAIAA